MPIPSTRRRLVDVQASAAPRRSEATTSVRPSEESAGCSSSNSGLGGAPALSGMDQGLRCSHSGDPDVIRANRTPRAMPRGQVFEPVRREGLSQVVVARQYALPNERAGSCAAGSTGSRASTSCRSCERSTAGPLRVGSLSPTSATARAWPRSAGAAASTRRGAARTIASASRRAVGKGGSGDGLERVILAVVLVMAHFFLRPVCPEGDAQALKSGGRPREDSLTLGS
jgi:hypothetical protein